MKKNTKILIICIIGVLIIAAVILAAVLINNKNYTDVYSSLELYEKVAVSITTDGGVDILDSDVILEFTEEELPYLNDYTVVKAKAAKNINEIGIFKVGEENTKDTKALLESYVADLQKAYRAMDYFPEEVEKINCATVKVFGDYVIYSFLNEKDTESFYNSVEKTLMQ